MARERSAEGRGNWGRSTDHPAPVERAEEKRRGGGRYDAGPGFEGLPGAQIMDRPPSQQGTFGRTGDRRGGVNRGIEDIQDQDRRGR